MPKKTKSQKNTKSKPKGPSATGELPFRDSYQEYGQIDNKYGLGRYGVLCYDGATRICKEKTRSNRHGDRISLFNPSIQVGEIVLVSLRDLVNTIGGKGDNKGDIVYRYNPTETRKLRDLNHIPTKLVGDDTEDIDVLLEDSIYEDNIVFVSDDESQAETNCDETNEEKWYSSEDDRLPEWITYGGNRAGKPKKKKSVEKDTIENVVVDDDIDIDDL